MEITILLILAILSICVFCFFQRKDETLEEAEKKPEVVKTVDETMEKYAVEYGLYELYLNNIDKCNQSYSKASLYSYFKNKFDVKIEDEDLKVAALLVETLNLQESPIWYEKFAPVVGLKLNSSKDFLICVLGLANPSKKLSKNDFINKDQKDVMTNIINLALDAYKARGEEKANLINEETEKFEYKQTRENFFSSISNQNNIIEENKIYINSYEELLANQKENFIVFNQAFNSKFLIHLSRKEFYYVNDEDSRNYIYKISDLSSAQTDTVSSYMRIIFNLSLKNNKIFETKQNYIYARFENKTITSNEAPTLAGTSIDIVNEIAELIYSLLTNQEIIGNPLLELPNKLLFPINNSTLSTTISTIEKYVTTYSFLNIYSNLSILDKNIIISYCHNAMKPIYQTAIIDEKRQLNDQEIRTFSLTIFSVIFAIGLKIKNNILHDEKSIIDKINEIISNSDLLIRIRNDEMNNEDIKTELIKLINEKSS